MSNKIKGATEFVCSGEKARYLYYDYVMTDNPEEKDLFLEMLGTYIDELNNPKASLIYSKVCDCGENEKEAYIEILGDMLENNTAGN